MSGANVDGYFLTRAEQIKLADYLSGVRPLMADLAITIAKLDRVGEQVRVRRTAKQSELDPLNFDALAAADELHNALTTWVRLVCEQRCLDPPAIEVTAQAAVWLHAHMIALALTEGAHDALDEIGNACERALRYVAPRPAPIEIDMARVAVAREHELSASGIECAAPELGEEYRHLTRKRVNNLHEGGHITPVRICSLGTPVYRLGDVLAAHLKVPNRKLSTQA